MSQANTKYDIGRSYDWNFDHAPSDLHRTSQADSSSTGEVPMPQRDWTFCGLPVASPIGIAAGPLLNGRWLQYYSQFDYEVLTYKTVRSSYRACYDLPNLQPIQAEKVDQPGSTVSADRTMNGSWAISFGMPSKEPQQWRRDLEWTRNQLPDHKILSVSVVATPQPDWTVEQIAEDYAQCAWWAVESGADSVELNFSCPNVNSADGQLYQNASVASEVLRVVRDRVPGTPLIIKIGYVSDQLAIENLCRAVDGLTDAISMTNCIAARVKHEEDSGAAAANGGPGGDARGLLFDGQVRGIGGSAILEASVAQVARFRQAISRLGSSLQIIGVGGVSNPDHVRRYLDAGAHHVHIATAAMLDPTLGQRIASCFNGKHRDEAAK